MTNEMKLLTAFIEASGFDIEEVKEEYIEREPSGFLVNKYMSVGYKVTKRTVGMSSAQLNVLKTINKWEREINEGLSNEKDS